MLRFAALLGALAAGLLTLSAVRAATPSFDCDGSKSDVEKLICQDDELAELDVNLAKRFATALAKAPADAVASLRASQKSWRQQLLKCGRASDPRACAKHAYDDRLGSF